MKIERDIWITNLEITTERQRDYREWPVMFAAGQCDAKIGLCDGTTFRLCDLGHSEASALQRAIELKGKVRLVLECPDADAKTYIRAAREQSKIGNTKAALEHALKAIEMLTGDK